MNAAGLSIVASGIAAGNKSTTCAAQQNNVQELYVELGFE
jgi:hypothetical protein